MARKHSPLFNALAPDWSVLKALVWLCDERERERPPDSPERCSRDSDWCDGTTCIANGVECPRADVPIPLGELAVASRHGEAKVAIAMVWFVENGYATVEAKDPQRSWMPSDSARAWARGDAQVMDAHSVELEHGTFTGMPADAVRRESAAALGKKDLAANLGDPSGIPTRVALGPGRGTEADRGDDADAQDEPGPRPTHCQHGVPLIANCHWCNEAHERGEQ